MNPAKGGFNELRNNAADPADRIVGLGANGFNIPSLLSVHSTPPYYHNGIARTLDQVLDGSFDGVTVGGASGMEAVHNVTDANNRRQLIKFLQSIDDSTTPFN